MSINSSLKNAMLTSGGFLSVSDNQPSQYGSRKHQYYGRETDAHIAQYAKYSSDFFEARVQGIDPNEPYAWQTRLLRMADVVRPSAAILRKADNYKMVLFADADIQYLMPGAKIVTMGSTWIVTNPFNVSGGKGSGIVERCNAVWNHLDYYGNVVSEPMVITNPRADANTPDAQEANLITKGYFNAIMQYNDDTAQINTNTRFILGNAAYKVTGYSDFHQEFTGDYNTVRLLEFSIRYEEPNAQIDDMENHVAEGLTFDWTAHVSGAANLTVGQTAQMEVTSERNGESVASTTEYPISYLWTSSDESVATVDANGAVTAVSDGNAVITATLEQNAAYSANIEVTAASASADGEVRFTTPIPSELKAYEDCEIGAAYFENGAETDEQITFALSGADDSTYTFVSGQKTVTIYGFGYSETPLTVTATHGTKSVGVEINLRGL